MVEYIGFVLVIIILAIVYYFYRRVSQARKTLIENIFTWFLFSVLFSLTPIVFNAVILSLKGTNLALPSLLSNGELLLVSTAISADATGRLIGGGKHERLLKQFAAGGSLLVLLLSSLLFAAISSSSAGTFAEDKIANISVFVFLVTLIASGSCVVLSELEPRGYF